MRLLFWLHIIFLLLTGLLSNAQQACNCPEFAAIKSSLIANEYKNGETTLSSLASLNKPGCAVKSLELKAELLVRTKQTDSAEILLQKAFSLYKKSNCGEDAYLNYYQLLAQILHNKGEYDKSLELSFKILSITERAEDVYAQASCLLLMSHSFNRMKQSEKGIEYARKAIPLLRKMEITYEKADILNKLSSRYLWRYQDLKKDPDRDVLLDSAEAFTKEQISICRQINNKSLLMRGYSHMNGYAHERRNYKLALAYIDSSLRYLQPGEDDAKIATNYGDKADVYMEMGDFKLARAFADSCLSTHQRNKNPELIANAYALIYEISNRTNNYKDALGAMTSYMEINDSLTKVEKTKVITELEKKYNQAKNEQKISELAQQKRIYLLLAVAGLLALVGLVFFIRQQTLKNKQKILEAEQRLNRARMNPHFFFNALASLQSLALRENDGKTLAGNLSKFSHIMRETLESTYKEYVTIEQEIDFLNEYLELQKMRFPQKFSYTIQAAEDIEPQELLIPSMIIQPFAENSIEHGFTGIDYPGALHINFSKFGNEIKIVVSDNGAGFSGLSKNNDSHVSRASQIIKDRIYLLNVKLKTKARFSIDNHPDGKGILVEIFLPEITENESTDNR